MSLSRSDQARLNGAKSRGPKTAQGKARASLNALKHGRYATNAIVLSNEDPEAFEELVGHYVRRIQPTDQMEYYLTRELAGVSWRLARIVALDSRAIEQEMDIQSSARDSAGLHVSELTRVSNAGRALVERSKYPGFLARRETQLVRIRRTILRDLRDLRKDFPLAASVSEIIPPQPLDPDLPISIEPGTNPAEMDPLPQSAPECGSADSQQAPLGCTEASGSATNGTRPGSAPSCSSIGNGLAGPKAPLGRARRPVALPETTDPAVELGETASVPPLDAVNPDRHANGRGANLPKAA